MSDTLTTQIPGYIAGTWDIDPTHTEISFSVRHMMVSKVRGRFDTFEGSVVTAPEPLGSHVGDRCIASYHKSRGRTVIRIAEIHALAQRRGRRQRGNHGITVVVAERGNQGIEAAHLNGAIDLEVLANHARDIDVKAGRIAVGAGKIKGRIIDFGQKPNRGDVRQIRPFRPPPRVPKTGHADRRLIDRGCLSRNLAGRAGNTDQ